MTSRPVPAASAPDVLGRVLLPLRAFLGFTFCFAGLQKLANPKFFDAADPASIQSQLAAAARRSPVHALITPLAHIAIPLGILIALGELAVGVGALLGFRAKAAAAGGIALSLLLFLTVSFHSSPYYTGADIVSRSPGRRCCWPAPARSCPWTRSSRTGRPRAGRAARPRAGRRGGRAGQ